MVHRQSMTGFNRRLSLVVKRIDQVELVFTGACMVTIILINGAEIFSRYILDISLFFVYEITMLLANWMYFIGFCLVFNRSKDIEIEFFTNLLSLKNQWYTFLATKITIMIFLLMLGYFAFQLMLIQSRHSTEGLNIPNHLFSMPIFIGTISMILSITRDTISLAVSNEENQGDN